MTPRRTMIGPAVLAVCLAAAVATWAKASFFPAAVEALVKSHCLSAGCHTGRYPAAGMSLDPDMARLAAFDRPAQSNPSFKIIDPASPEKSYLLMKLRGAEGIEGRRMPLRREPLSEADIKTVADWLASFKATDDLAAEPSGQKKSLERPAFWGLSLAGLPTAETLERGRFLFRIAHRFMNSLTGGEGSFLGLDGPASIMLGAGYGLTGRWTLTLGRSNLLREVEAGLAFRALDQSGGAPFGLALRGGASLLTQKTPGRDLFDAADIRWLLSASFSRAISGRVSLLLVPAFAANTDLVTGLRRGTFALGLGGRWRIVGDIALFGEWTPVLSGFSEAANGWAAGIEKKIGGHVFQFFALNAAGIATAQRLPGGDLRLRHGGFRIGFNIDRLF
jgi:hypothetical protein